MIPGLRCKTHGEVTRIKDRSIPCRAKLTAPHLVVIRTLELRSCGDHSQYPFAIYIHYPTSYNKGYFYICIIQDTQCCRLPVIISETSGFQFSTLIQEVSGIEGETIK